MKRILILSFCVLLSISTIVYAQSQRNPCTTTTGDNCIPVSPNAPLPVSYAAGYPAGVTPIVGAITGTTAAITATLAATSTTTAFICGFHIDATGTGSIGPVTLSGIIGSTGPGSSGTMRFQGTAGASNGIPVTNFTPCIPASAINTNITITTTADPSATEVDVNAWGYIK